MTDSLIDRVALITGGSKGIGRAVALAFAQEGADVALCARNMPDLEAVAEEVRGLGRRAFAFTCDVMDAAQVDQIPAQVTDNLGPIDILVNNAGASASHKFITHPDDLWQRMLDLNLTSVYRVCKVVVPGMIERQWGRIINMASIASKRGGRYVAAYTAAKHGVLGLTRALATELNRDNITVNAICPGYVDTPMTDGSVANIVARTGKSEAEARQILESGSPQNRLITPEEVAAVAVLLAGEAARGITSQAINVDGGLLLF